MIEEAFTDLERQRLKLLVMTDLARLRVGPQAAPEVGELVSILSKLNGTDTVIVAQRAYPSRSPKDIVVGEDDGWLVLFAALDGLPEVAEDAAIISSRHFPISDAPQNRRVLIFGNMPDGTEEMAMAWKDRMDERWYFAPQGGLVPFTPTKWCHVPQPTCQVPESP